MTDSFPLLPFDPREKGPMDVAKDGYESTKEFVDENSRALIIAVAALIGLAWRADLSMPDVPTWLWIMVLSGTVSVPPMAYFSWQVADALHRPDVETLSIQNPASGDQRIKHVSPDTFEQLEVWNAPPEHEDATKVDTTYLEEVRINGIRAWEVDDYRPDEGIVVASAMAGRTHADIRRDRNEIAAIKYDLITQTEKATQFLVEAHGILRKQGEEVAHELVRVVEDVDLPQGDQLHDRLWKARNEADPSDDLLDSEYDFEPDRGDEEDEEQQKDDGLDIYDRAAQNGSSADEARADGGNQ